jgi:L,D-peptidoglycan transpeptidase YkuD (ErfK/YbiS/YcfS/YnhG family)
MPTIRKLLLRLLIPLLSIGFAPHANSVTPESQAPFEFLTLDPETLQGIQNIPPTTSIRSVSRNERRLLQILNTLKAGDLIKATRQAQALVQAAPNYALAQLLYADLLRLQKPSSGVWLESTPADTHTPHPINEALSSNLPPIQAAQLELSLRLKALEDAPATAMIPTHLISMGNHYRQLITVDTELGRLSLFDISHPNNRPRLVLKHSFFITIGEKGAGKQIEGDKKTPHGIYQLLDRIPQDILPDLYGIGALNMNYPNPIDRKLGRTGHGIWFHGSPSATYVRAPLSSDGCVVLSNDDMQLMLSAATAQQTLVIIDQGINWKPTQHLWKPDEIKQHPLHRKLTTLISDGVMISNDFTSSDYYEGGSKWEYRLLRLVQSNKNIQRSLSFRNITLVDWERDTPYSMVEFDFQLNAQSKVHRVRQYWMNIEGDWKIVRESIL